ncbi:MAG: PEP-utilizing enzyme [Patescibacteria group bacterium]|nr:PEP-utilizing enzyme [Patescibacteria group bacterium]
MRYINIDELDWFLLEKYNDFPYLVLSDFIFHRSFEFKKQTGYYLNSVLLYRNNAAYTCFERKSFIRNKKYFFNRMVSSPAFYSKTYRNENRLHRRWNLLTVKLYRQVKRGNWQRTALLLGEWHKLFIKIAMAGQPMNVVEFDDAWLTEHLNKNFGDIENKKRLLELAAAAMQAKKKRYLLYLNYKDILEKLATSFAKKKNINFQTLLNLSFDKFLLFIKCDRALPPPKKEPEYFGTAYCNGKQIPLTAGSVKKIIQKISAIKTPLVAELKGQGAMSGTVTGQVCLVLSRDDLKKMKKNLILVAHTTTADLMPAVKKAAAIISDMGGITSHAAIVSREFKIPSVIGTKIATEVLKDGDMVEVDANNGIIKIIKPK